MKDFNDKRFLDTGADNKENEKRSPIKLPGMDYSDQEKTDSPHPAKSGYINEQEIKSQDKINPPYENKTASAEQELAVSTKKEASGSRYIIGIFLLIVLLVVSIFLNCYFYTNISELRHRIETKSKDVESIAIEKEDRSKERAAFEEKIDSLKGDLLDSSQAVERMKKEKETVLTQLDKSAQEIATLKKTIEEKEKEIKSISDETKNYYNASKKGQAKIKDLENSLTERENEINSLKINLAQKVLEGTKKEIDSIYDVALLNIKSGMYDEALRNFNKILELDGNNAEAHYNIALIYEEVKNDPEAAIQHYQKYCQLKPNAEDLYEIKAKIASHNRTVEQELGDATDLKNLKSLKQPMDQ